MKPWLVRSHRIGHHILGWRDGASDKALLLANREIIDLVSNSPLRKREPELKGILVDPNSDLDKGAEKARLVFARYLTDLWKKGDPKIRRFQFRETYPKGEPYTWLSILACYKAFKPDFAYYEAQRPSGSFVLLRKRSEGLTNHAEWFGIKAPVVIDQSEVAHVVGSSDYVVMSLKSGERVLLTHGSIIFNPSEENVQYPFNIDGAATID